MGLDMSKMASAQQEKVRREIGVRTELRSSSCDRTGIRRRDALPAASGTARTGLGDAARRRRPAGMGRAVDGGRRVMQCRYCSGRSTAAGRLRVPPAATAVLQRGPSSGGAAGGAVDLLSAVRQCYPARCRGVAHCATVAAAVRWQRVETGMRQRQRWMLTPSSGRRGAARQ